eukprot:940053-Rhodomonas_salina.1
MGLVNACQALLAHPEVDYETRQAACTSGLLVSSVTRKVQGHVISSRGLARARASERAVQRVTLPCLLLSERSADAFQKPLLLHLQLHQSPMASGGWVQHNFAQRSAPPPHAVNIRYRSSSMANSSSLRPEPQWQDARATSQLCHPRTGGL